MYKLLLDADALIKLASCGALPKIGEVCLCTTTPEVERETVEEGKKKMYADAEIIEALIKNGIIKIKKAVTNLTGSFNLEMGEISILQLSREIKDQIIVSDDQAFIKELERQEINFLVPADLLILLTQTGKLEPQETAKYAERLKTSIRERDYLKLKKEIGG